MTAPRMPAGLRKEERAAWRQLVTELGGRSVLSAADAPLLRSLAVLMARGENLRFALQEADLLVPTVRGMTGNPLLGHERETIKEIRLLHKALADAIAERGGARSAATPKSLHEVRDQLRAV